MSHRGTMLPKAGVIVCVVALALTTAPAEVVTIPASKDNTLYEDASGSLSNGAGKDFFVGRTSTFTNTVRRAVIAFDVAVNVPAGATIDSVTLTLHLSRAPFLPGDTPVELRRLLADWGEGTSNPIGQEGGGAPATSGDATWLHRFFNTVFWNSPGGDFSTTVSASRLVRDVAFYTWGPTDRMRADVQGWLDDPATNFGWLLLGNEIPLETARAFDSRQGIDPSLRPSLTINFTAAATGAGSVPDGGRVPGTPLTVEHAAGGTIRLDWGASCSTGDNDFEIYEGSLDALYSHTMKFCTTGGTTTSTFLPAPGSTYYIVVPRNGPREGSYGSDGAGAERPQGAPACLAREIAVCP